MLRWRIAILVSAAIAISYLDRQTLPIAIGAIREDIPISNQIKAFLDSAFLVTYGLMYLGGGRLMDVLGTRKGFTVIMIFWSLACASHGLATNVIMLAASRLLLGIGEGGGFPAATRRSEGFHVFLVFVGAGGREPRPRDERHHAGREPAVARDR